MSRAPASVPVLASVLVLAPFAAAADDGAAHIAEPKPSFACSGTLDRVRRMICDDPHLVALDAELERAVAFPSDGPHARRRRREQIAWSARRDGCFDAECLRRLYVERLAGIAPQPHGFSLTGLYEQTAVMRLGRATLVPRANGTVRLTVESAGRHVCRYDGALAFAEKVTAWMDPQVRALRYRLEAPDATGSACKVDVLSDGETMQIETSGCRADCGAAGSVDGVYRKIR